MVRCSNGGGGTGSGGGINTSCGGSNSGGDGNIITHIIILHLAHVASTNGFDSMWGGESM